jgi:EAL and modified HD-GYP domain-containing signal transduction protein
MVKAASRVYVGRQPIVDATQQVLGYELLFRDGPTRNEARSNGDLATTQVIVNTFIEFGLERLVGDKLAFVNVTRPFLVGTLPLPFQPNEAVLEVLEDVVFDESLQKGVRRLVDAGYRIALDDFVPGGPTTQLLPLATYVKLDVLALQPHELWRVIDSCQKHDVSLIAERVETKDMLTTCIDLGFDYFQGYLLARPSIEDASSLSPSTTLCLQILSELTRPEITYTQLEEVVRLDVGLSYRLLRAVNAAAIGIPRAVSSLREALVLLGLRQLRAWILLMVLADAGEAEPEQLGRAMTRARMCEVLSSHMRDVKSETAFTVGLLSTLDFLLGVPIATVVDRLPLQDEVAEALVHRTGRLGQVLDLVEAYEKQDLMRLIDCPIDLSDLATAYLSATSWSLENCQQALAA